MAETITPDQFRDQFCSSGYIAEVMGIYRHNIRTVSADWFDLVEDTNVCLGAIAVKAMETQRGVVEHRHVRRQVKLDHDVDIVVGPVVAPRAEGRLVFAKPSQNFPAVHGSTPAQKWKIQGRRRLWGGQAPVRIGFTTKDTKDTK